MSDETRASTSAEETISEQDEQQEQELSAEELDNVSGGFSQAQYDSWERMGTVDRSSWPTGTGE